MSSLSFSEWEETLHDSFYCTLLINILAVNSSLRSRFMPCTCSTRCSEFSDRAGFTGRGDGCFEPKVRLMNLLSGCLGVSYLGVITVCKGRGELRQVCRFEPPCCSPGFLMAERDSWGVGFYWVRESLSVWMFLLVWL